MCVVRWDGVEALGRAVCVGGWVYGGVGCVKGGVGMSVWDVCGGMCVCVGGCVYEFVGCLCL